MKMKEKTNWTLMARVVSDMADGAKEGTREAAEVLKEDIREHWGLDGAPEIDSGNLDSAIRVDEHGRDDSGRFTGPGKASYYVTANASDGDSYHGRGNYGPALEYGRVGAPPYPFLRPAIERVAAIYPVIIERKMKK